MDITGIFDIIRAIEQFAPPSLQESWDNSGLQIGTDATECTGALVCVDVTPAVLVEAVTRHCNLIVSHHPLLFRGLREIDPDRHGVQAIAYEAIRRGIAVYSAHTSLDKAERGTSHRLAAMLGANVLRPLVPAAEGSSAGMGVVASFSGPISNEAFVARIKEAFGNPVVRCSARHGYVREFAICSGAGGEFIPRAIECGCGAYLTSEVRYHDFVDYGEQIFIADIGHFESEECAKDIFYDIISEKFPNFAVYKSSTEKNPIKYE